MTFWHLLVLAVLCAVLAGAAFILSDGYDTGSDITDLGLLFTTIVLAAGALGTGVGFIAFNMDRSACLEHGEQTGMTVHYELLSGCYVKVDNRLVPYDRWIQISGANAP